METINTVITAVSIIICLVLIAYFIRWSAWKRVKPRVCTQKRYELFLDTGGVFNRGFAG